LRGQDRPGRECGERRLAHANVAHTHGYGVPSGQVTVILGAVATL
jgi:hypothetical protein